MKLPLAILVGAVGFSILDLQFSIAQPTTLPATTQQATSQPAIDMKQSLADLGSSEARRREDARVDLMGLKRSDLPELRELVKKSLPLAPAQATALQEIVAQVYLAESEEASDDTGGFLGLHDSLEGQLIAQGDGLEGVLVQTRVPGFCGYRFLLEGDVIQKVTAPILMPLTSFDQLRAVIGMTAPGRTITLDVLRHGETRNVTIPLDARPKAMQQMGFGALAFENYIEQRKALAEEYWQKNFAPLLERSTL
jgi:hypothetical protein